MDSWDDILRGLFNIPRFPGQRDGGDSWVEVDIHDIDGEEDHGRQEDIFGDSFKFRFSQPDQMFKHFEDIFKDFGVAEFPPNDGGSGVLPRNDQISPRDRMLKDKSRSCPDCGPSQGSASESRDDGDSRPGASRGPSIFSGLWRTPHWDRIRPQDKVDTELDASDGRVLDEIVTGARADVDGATVVKRPPGGLQDAWSSFFGQSSSTRSVSKPDGSTETVHTVKSSDGREETRVTRTLKDGQSHTVITRKSPDGQEKEETFKHPDEADMDKFEGRWWGEKGFYDTDPRGAIINPKSESLDDETREIFKELFGFTLPGFSRS